VLTAANHIKASEYPSTILCCGREKLEQSFIFDCMFITFILLGRLRQKEGVEVNSVAKQEP
jgi:hypothetical protein